ncbi:MAG: DinB family protein [bacterium]|nr:DinB family protein [bacterium]
MKADTAYTAVGAFLDHWNGVRLVTLKLLESFEDGDLAQPVVTGGRSVGKVFHHIGGHQFFVARGVLTRRWRPDPGDPDADWTAHQERVARSVSGLHDWLAGTQSRLHEWIDAADESALVKLRPDNPWHKGMRGWLLLHHPYQDELHHRGQLYVAARRLGRVPPPVFAEEHPEYWIPRQGR